MSTAGKSSPNGNTDQCCRTCTGNITATYATVNVPPDPSATTFDLKGIKGPDVKKSCDKSMSSQADVKLDFELGNKIHDTVKQRITDLVSAGYYLENGKMFKGGASFETTVCTDNGEITVTIDNFNMHTFA